MTLCFPVSQKLRTVDTENWTLKGQENKTKLNCHPTVSYTYCVLFIQTLYPLGKRAKLLRHVLQGMGPMLMSTVLLTQVKQQQE